MAQRTFFKYEKRIRNNSSRDKVFEYFATVTDTDGTKFMQLPDLLRAIVPTYPPSASAVERGGSLAGAAAAAAAAVREDNPKGRVFEMFDIDGDGLISFYEYLLVLTLISIPLADLHIIFAVVDADGDGSIDAEEFQAVISQLQAIANIHGVKHGRGRNQPVNSSSGLLMSFFGADRKRRLALSTLRDFLRGLHESTLVMEFEHYDTAAAGRIPAQDLARSLVASADVRTVDGMLSRVGRWNWFPASEPPSVADSMDPALSQAQITFPEFQAAHLLGMHRHALRVALTFAEETQQSITPKAFKHLVAKLTGVELSGNIVKVIYALCGTAAGDLDIKAFQTLLSHNSKRLAQKG
ncbi:MAG: hypothetical protein WDW36_002455 [Sanguina aurantia]